MMMVNKLYLGNLLNMSMLAANFIKYAMVFPLCHRALPAGGQAPDPLFLNGKNALETLDKEKATAQDVQWPFSSVNGVISRVWSKAKPKSWSGGGSCHE
ncbi:hypothetical protein [Desulfuromonas acetoxidans]|uniref:hypothetical protein n=1 Tax=Desulfuromonas acetoxidans TaxID=891 RepID=UPI00292E23A4|nr:hypothetical protein [Desulfuromonas acetoxidans]